MPEKNGASVVATVGRPPTTLVPVVDWLVTKKESEPTLITAFWLFMVETRGLESTFRLPWVLSNSKNAAKLLAFTASVNTPPKAELLVPEMALKIPVVGFRLPVLPEIELSPAEPSDEPPPT